MQTAKEHIDSTGHELMERQHSSVNQIMSNKSGGDSRKILDSSSGGGLILVFHALRHHTRQYIRYRNPLKVCLGNRN